MSNSNLGKDGSSGASGRTDDGGGRVESVETGSQAGAEAGARPPAPVGPSAQSTQKAPPPTGLTVRRGSKVLEISFADGAEFSLPFELLRVFSPSAEVRGHGKGQEVLQTGKIDVDITAMEAVGHYAVQPQFSDGHTSGIYTWDYLYHLGTDQARLWEDYFSRLEAAGFSRESGRASDKQVAMVSGAGAVGTAGAPGAGSGPQQDGGKPVMKATAVSRNQGCGHKH